MLELVDREWLTIGIKWVLKKVEVVLLVDNSEFSSLEDDPVIIDGLNEFFSAISACVLQFCFEPLFESKAVGEVLNGVSEGNKGSLGVFITVHWEAWDVNSSFKLVKC